MNYKYIKRFFDLVSSVTGLVLTFPITAIITLYLLFYNNGKPFFLQQRPGKNGKLFKIIKFKTMNDNMDSDGNLLPYEKRITKLGIIIRKYSLDELPQLINVLKGDMSLIGPRPLLTKYLPLYNEYQLRRHDLKPGITGWAQVNGRNAISWEQKFNLDIYYVTHISFFLDLKILLLTIKKVLIKEGVNSSDNLNMAEFIGNN
ncbi:hypothetical protein SB49_02390 [Sediminicola sp. YIK13]|uniref:sugar transferase n=1 Tax=Sediminicola sp. YIK13 TaxID=1453352 RepID=UPI00071F928F|nr:sugar transferase [Sediminicola sp. YIK13]ALM06780.1 hypothetical protein SB49_02390 [Sediminicola sp. YIK13]